MGARRMLKPLVKRAVKRAAWAIGAFRKPDPERSVILTYHSVGHRRHDMNVTPEAFTAQVRWLAERGGVIPLAEAAKGAPGVALTFDDGFRDNLVNAAPVLGDLGLPATFFVVSGRLGQCLDDEPDPEHGVLMTGAEVRALADLGFDIGAHTRTHRRLRRLRGREQLEEIAGSKADLEALLGRPVAHFAYPYGSALDYGAVSLFFAKEAGFEVAVSNRYGANRRGADPLDLRRIWVDATDSLQLFQAKLTGRLDLLQLLEHRYILTARTILNHVTGR